MQEFLRRAKFSLVGGLTGLGTGLSFILVHDALTTDLLFDLREFGVALGAIALIAVLVALATKSNMVILLTIAYLTLLIPVLGASFGATGSEPLWQFAALGLIGGLVWSTSFTILGLVGGLVWNTSSTIWGTAYRQWTTKGNSTSTAKRD